MEKTFLNKILSKAKKKIETKKALSYLEKRGVTKNQAKSFDLGYFPEDEWPPYFEEKSDNDDLNSYLQWSSKGYRLKGKLVFPMKDARGNLRGIQVRSPLEDKKDYSKFYLERSRVSGIFMGTENALPHIWETGTVYLCEGLFDLFPLQRIFPNVLCTGTANTSKRQIKFLERYAKRVRIAFDMDEYGDKFYYRFRKNHGDKFEEVRRMKFYGEDVSDSWERLGEEEFKKRLTSEFKLDKV